MPRVVDIQVTADYVGIDAGADAFGVNYESEPMMVIVPVAEQFAVAAEADEEAI